MSFSITRSINIDAGHRVPNHASKCKNLHGHTYLVHATFASKGLEQTGAQEGMVLDFGFMKDVMMRAAHEPCDHGTILYYKDPLLCNLQDCSVESPEERLLRRIKYNFQQAFLDAHAILPRENWMMLHADTIAGLAEERMVREFHMFFEPINYATEKAYSIRQCLYHMARSILANLEINKLFDIEDFADISLVHFTNRVKVVLKKTDHSQDTWFFNLTGIREYGWEGTQLYLTGFVPTAENLAKHWGERMWLELKLDERVPPQVYVENVRVWETPNCYADYTPTR